MPSNTYRLKEAGVIRPPLWLATNLHLEVIMGSRAYGCNDEDSSDFDIRGVFTPPKSYCFPSLDGLVNGFDDIPNCEHWNQAHLKDPDGKREFDFDLHNITKFLRLAMENNPNQVDLLFTRENNITHCTAVGRMMLDSRKLFPSKLLWKRFRGYAAAQWHKLKMREQTPELKTVLDFEKSFGIPHNTMPEDVDNELLSRREPIRPAVAGPLSGLNGSELSQYETILKTTLSLTKRLKLIKQFSFDCKFAYHAIRLLNEAEQMLTTGDMDLTDGSEEYKAIRRGEWSFERLEKEFETRKIAVEAAYQSSKLPETPDHQLVKSLLMNCLEHHYGSLGNAVKNDAETRALRDIEDIIIRVRGYQKNG